MFDGNTVHLAPPSPPHQVEDQPERRILVVEDDVDLCMLIRQVIQEMGAQYSVQFASTVHEAAMWLDGSNQFDLVIADFLLADSRSGYELRAICQDRAPEATFRMMSAMPLQLPELTESEFLQKPFTAPQCEAFIGTALESEVASAEPTQA